MGRQRTFSEVTRELRTVYEQFTILFVTLS